MQKEIGICQGYVEAMWLMLQQDESDDFVIATGKTHSVREFTELAFREVGIELEWKGTGVDEVGVNSANGDIFNRDRSALFQADWGGYIDWDPMKAKEKLGWEAKVGFEELVKMMVEGDLGMLWEEFTHMPAIINEIW